MPKIVGDIVLAYNPYADRAHCIAVEKSGMTGRYALSFSVSKTIEQGKFIQDGDTINLEGNYDEVINYNYIQAWIKPAQDTSSSTILTLPAYFFITSYRYLNNDTTAVTIELDSVQTYYNYIDQLSGHLARSHAPRQIATTRTDSSGASQSIEIISPDLYYAEDEPVDNYQQSSSLDITLRNVKPSGTKRQLLLLLNLSEDTVGVNETAEGEFTGYIRCNPEQTTTEFTYSTRPADFKFSSYHPASVTAASYTRGSNACFTTLTINWDVSASVTSSTATLDYPLLSDLTLKSPLKNQLVCVIVNIPFDNTEFTASVSSIISSRSLYLNAEIEWGLDSLLYFGPLLADKIVSAFEIPGWSPYGTLADTSGYKECTFNWALSNTNENTSGEQPVTHNIQSSNTNSGSFSGYIITDLRELHGVLGSTNIRTRLRNILYFNGLPGTTTDGERSVTRELKLELYPYSFTSINFSGNEILYKYQDVSPMRWTGIDSQCFFLSPFYIIDPLATTPTIYCGYVGQNPGTSIVSEVDRYIGDSDSTLALALKNIATLMGTPLISWTGTDCVSGDFAFLEDVLSLKKLSDLSVSYLPSYAVYQDSYQEYQNYSKALAVVENEYQYKMAEITKNQSVTSGIIGSVGAILGLGVGGLSTAFGLAGINGADSTLAWMGGSNLISGASNLANNVSSAYYAGQTFDAQTAYIYSKQSALEASVAGKPPTHTGGNSSNSAMAFLKNQRDPTTAGNGYASIETYSYPAPVMAQLEQRFYRWGYSIPEDVVLEGDTALSKLPWLKSQFFYIQFDNVQSISFKFKEGYSNDDEGVRHDYFHTVPMIYQQDICDRLCRGITFVRADGNDGDVSTLKIDYSKDNYDTQTLDHPLYNRWWQN